MAVCQRVCKEVGTLTAEEGDMETTSTEVVLASTEVEVGAEAEEVRRLLCPCLDATDHSR
jgi:hypothetical protein